jgi:hypothetical protein
MLGQRTLQVMGLALTALVGTFALWCGSSDSPSGSGGGGSTGTGGTGAGTGGSTATGGGGVRDASSGGGTVSDVANDAYPASCNDTPVAFCTPAMPAQALISDFSAPEAGVPAAGCDGTTFISAFGVYGDEYFGGTYVYPTACTDACVLTSAPSATPLSQDLSAGNWHISGTVGTYSGFGIYISHRTAAVDPLTGTAPYAGIPYTVMDASQYSGIKFTISGDAGPSGNVIAVIQSAATSIGSATRVNDLHPAPGDTFTTCGTCPVAPCGNIDVPVTVTSTATPVTITWAQAGITDPGKFMNISWRFNFVAGSTYPVNVTVDDVQFVP